MKRDFLCLSDLTRAELDGVLDLAATLKAEPRGARAHLLRGRAVAIVMEKASTRTRISFEVGVAQLGGHPVIVTTQGTQLARGEPVRDTARVLAGYCDAIVYRTSETSRLRDMASVGVPVVNALTDDAHPAQVLADVLTMRESLAARGLGALTGRRVAFVGDGSSNMARSFVEAARIFEFHLALAAPNDYRPPAAELEAAGSWVSLHERPEPACEGAEFVHTDVWTSMGQEAENTRRQAAFQGYTVDAALLAKASPTARVMHCLPAHRGEEITADVLESGASIVFDQAENRLHAQKALLLFLFGLGVA